jgi:putative PEP-CTERM system histidine kinase
MDPIVFVRHLPLVNALVLAAVFVLLISKAHLSPQIWLLSISLLPLLAFQIGTYFFVIDGPSKFGPLMIVLGILLLPAAFAPLSRRFARKHLDRTSKPWITYYGFQIALLGVALTEVFTGHIIEWVTGILDQPVIIIGKNYRLLFLNVLLGCGLSLICLERTLKSASRSQAESLKSIFIAYVGFIVYFAYLCSQILVTSYFSETELLSGAAITSIGTVLLFYSLVKYPLWEVKISVTRRVVFGSLSVTAILTYLIISGTVIGLLREIRPERYSLLFPAAVFALAALFLLVYLSPKVNRSFELFVSNYFFKNRYDYRELWMRFSEKSSGSLELAETLRRVGEFIADAMFQRQVAIWVRTPNSEAFVLEYLHDTLTSTKTNAPAIQWRLPLSTNNSSKVKTILDLAAQYQDLGLSADNINELRELGVHRVVTVEKGDEVIAILGVGGDSAGNNRSVEDDRLLVSISNQLAHLIVNLRLSEELLLAREWESFNRFSSFVIHDLKNLATLQGMTLENAKSLSNDPKFLADAFETFGQSTDKMINLIASLSVQRGQFSLNKRPVNILEIISSTFDELKIDQREGLMVKTTFPPPEPPPVIAGDPELLKKVFTNLLLNAIQSLPKGRGSVEVSVGPPGNRVIRAGIKDNGCGIEPERMKNLFRPFQTTKKNGMGVGLCHTRSIVEIHGGHLHIDSRLNEGTLVEIEFPRLFPN